jgi:hypothetical protein
LLIFPLGYAPLLPPSAFADGMEEPIPSFYQEPGLAPNRDFSRNANERIDPFTGKLQWHYVDTFLPANGGMDIKVQRSYSSMNEVVHDNSPVGMGWTMHFGRVLRKGNVDICMLGQGSTVNSPTSTTCMATSPTTDRPASRTTTRRTCAA